MASCECAFTHSQEAMSSCENFESLAALAEICSLQVRLVYFVKWQP